jgi:hypothetical protein
VKLKTNQNMNDPVTHHPIIASTLLQNYRPMGHQEVGLWDDFNSLSYKYKPNYVRFLIYKKGRWSKRSFMDSTSSCCTKWWI